MVLDIHYDMATTFSGCSSVMVARAAQWNLSVFRYIYIKAPPHPSLPHPPNTFSFPLKEILSHGYHTISNHHHVYTCIIIVHRKEGLLPIDDIIRDYVKLAVDCDNYHANSKYCLAQLLHDNMASPQGKALLASSTMRELW